jgi:hypothetical protein
MASFLKKAIQAGAKVAEVAAPVAGAVLGGPAGAAAGAKLAGSIKKVASTKALGGKGSGGAGSFTPSTASSIADARAQDKTRMQKQYGIGGTDETI